MSAAPPPVRPRSPSSLAARALALTCLCAATISLSCQAGDAGGPTVAERQPDPPAPTAMSLVHHREAVIAPRVDWLAAAIEQTPMSLTAGDGTGLRLVEVTGTVVIEDPLAFTELHLTFENPEPRRREGRFAMNLPQGAALSRLAMRIGGRWMEGEVIERQRARETFESYIHFRPKVDPALLEQAAANRVSARVFPIAPRERKQIIVSYSQPLALGEDESYRLPLQGLPELEDLDLRVIVRTVDDPDSTSSPSSPDRAQASTQRVIEIREHDFAPQRDLVIALDGAGEAGAVKADDLVAVRIQPEPIDSHEPVESLTVLFDTSASGSPGFDAEIDRLGLMLAALGDRAVRIVAFDQEVTLIHEGPAAAALGPALARLRERRAFGASNLEAALAHNLLRSASPKRLLIWSDGVATAGEVSHEAIARAATELGLARVDAYASTPTADREQLTALASAGARAGVVIGPAIHGGAIVDYLEGGSFDGVGVDIEGAQWSYPTTLDGFAPGDDVVVFARFPADAPSEVRVAFSDARLPTQVVHALDGAAPLVTRAVARAQVSDLQRQIDSSAGPEARAAKVQELVELAIDNRLLTQHTALLVLENDDEYRRHRIRRAARTNILVAGAEGIDVLRRREGRAERANQEPDEESDEVDDEADATASGLFAMDGPERELHAHDQRQRWAPPSDAFAEVETWGSLGGDAIGEAAGVGGLGIMGAGKGSMPGLIGTGRGGGGTGEGTIGLGNTGLIGKGSGGGTGQGYGRGSSGGFGGRGKPTPRVRQADPQIQGALDKAIIRRVVRAHINELRSCYNQGLTRDGALAGQVVIKFIIAASGQVSSAAATAGTLGDPSVSTCMAEAARRWKFPRPDAGSTVAVRYPFDLSPAAPASSWSRSASVSRPRRRPGDPSQIHDARWAGSAQSGRFGQLATLAAGGQREQALADAWEWATTEPDNTLALVALGEQLELDGRPQQAARVYGSLIDLHPERADIRRTASARLERVDAMARMLAVDSYRKALAQRPDQINGHRLLAWALAKDGAYEDAFEVLGDALAVSLPANRFRGVKDLIRDDRRLLAAAWLAASVNDPAVQAKLRAADVSPETAPSLRIAAHWETDSTDVDIIVTPLGPGDGRRHADVRTGFGPEAWISRGRDVPRAASTRVRYFNRGAMGYAMGTVSTVSHDGAGNLRIADEPFVLMNASGSVEVGSFSAASSGA